MIEPRHIWASFFSVFALTACDDAASHARDAAEEETPPSLADDSGQSEDGGPTAPEPDELLEDARAQDAEESFDAEDAGEPDAEGQTVKHDSFETALRIEADGPGILTDERAADQVDYFVFAGEAGAFYELTTHRGTFSPDNVISLYDADRQLIAENDVGWIWPGDAIDTRLVVRLPATGDYFVRVEDRFTPPEFFEAGPGISTLLYYMLHVREIHEDTPGYAFADRSSAGLQLLEHEASGYRYLTLLGQFDADGEVLAFSGIADDLLVGHMHPGGPSGSGSTAQGGRVRVLSGARVLAEIDRAKGQEHIHPPVSDGGHQVSISAEGALGDNPFYALDLVLIPDNPREQAEAMNGTLAGAEPIAFTGRGRRRGLLLSTLGGGDVDYYKLDAVSGQQVAIGCEGESAGSGVRQLRVELRDAADAVLAGASESATDTLQLPIVQVGQTAAYYLRLSSDAPVASSQVEPWTRCSIAVN